MPGLLDRTIDEAREVLVRRHLAECRQCAQELEETRRTWGLLESAEKIEPPAWFHESVMAQIAVAHENEARRASQSWWRSLLTPDTPGRWAAASVAAALVVMTLFSVFASGPQGIVQGGFQSLFGKKQAAEPPIIAAPVRTEPAVKAAQPSLTPAMFYRRLPVTASDGTTGLVENEGYHTFSLTASGASHPIRVSVKLLPAGAAFNPADLADLSRAVWEGSLEPGQSLYIPIRLPGDLKESSIATVVVEMGEANRYLLYLPASSQKAEEPGRVLALRASVTFREAIRQAAESLDTPFWVDARITGRVQQEMPGLPALEALRQAMESSGATLQKGENLYSVLKP